MKPAYKIESGIEIPDEGRWPKKRRRLHRPSKYEFLKRMKIGDSIFVKEWRERVGIVHALMKFGYGVVARSVPRGHRIWRWHKF